MTATVTTVIEAPQWRGKDVPPTLAAWFDQLLQSQTLIIIQTASEARHLDVVLTVSPDRGVTRVPDIIAKGPARSKNGKRQM
jgi:hypothetical protein